MDPEILLIKKILQTGDLKTPIRQGIIPEYFVDKEAATWYKWIIDWAKDHQGTVPKEETLKYHFRQARFPDNGADISMDEIIGMVKVKQTKAICVRVADKLYSIGQNSCDLRDLMNLCDDCNKDLANIGRMGGTNFTRISEEFNFILEDYDNRKDGKAFGIPWPWPLVNEKTNGIENETLTIIYGRPKNMKTWVALYIGIAYYKISLGGRIIFYSCEMPREQIARRATAMIAGVDYSKFLKGSLSPEQEEILKYILTNPKQGSEVGFKKDFILIEPKEPSIMDLRANIDRFGPDLVIIDAVQYMATGGTEDKVDFKKQTRLSQELKECAKIYKLPIIATHQANRGKEKEGMENLALSDSWGRDPDVIIEVQRIKDERLGTILALLFRGAREFDLTGIFTHAKPAHNFELIEEIPSLASYEEYIKANKKRAKENEDMKKRVRNA
jgi:hypothetical protein